MCRELGCEPIVMTPKIILPTSKQVQDYVLCEECEQLFSSKGEKYVAKLVYDGENFPLLDKLQLALTIKEEPNLNVYSATALGLDVDKLAYFALIVFWRASVHKWHTIGAQTTSTPLGAHEEPIRKFLRGEVGFPSDIAIVSHACSDHASKELIFFPTAAISSTYATHSLLVRGIYFRLLTGLSPKAHGRKLCIVNSPRHVIFEEDCRARTKHAYSHLQKTARVARKLK